MNTKIEESNFVEKVLTVNNNSVERVGYPKEFTNALAEYIWNSLDAQSTLVEIKYKKNVLGGIEHLSISDNGLGIDCNNIENIFGVLLDSPKKIFIGNNLSIHGKKGKGRFAFQLFSQIVTWNSVFEKDGERYSNTVKLNIDNKIGYKYTHPKKLEDKNIQTGTVVEFLNLKPICGDIEKAELEYFLQKEFGWFLYLKRKQKVRITLNDKELKYNDIISNSDTISMEIEYEQKKYNFEFNYIEWNTNIGDTYYYYYFLDDEYSQKGKKPTKLNHNQINFHHSLFVVSKYFDKYAFSEDVTSEYQMKLFDKDDVFNLLLKRLHSYLQHKQKLFIEKNSEALIDKLEKEGVMPKFNANKYDQERKNDLVQVTKSIFKIQPKLFIGVSELHKKSFLALLNLLLDTDERNNILKIINSLVNDLSFEEREDLAKVLEKTRFNKIVRTLKAISQRYKNIQILKTLIYNYTKETKERDHIQKIMEECFWLFGEQYNLVANDITFQKLLEKYYKEILKKDLEKTVPEENEDRRPDIFLARILPIAHDPSTLLEENIIVELKAPAINIGIKQFRQVEDYLNFIKKKPEFNGDSRRWKFFLIGKDLTDDIKEKVRTKQKEGKEQFLVDQSGNHSIYAMKWDDLFRSFDIKNNFLLENLNLDREVIIQELESEGLRKDEMPDFLTKQVLETKYQPIFKEKTN